MWSYHPPPPAERERPTRHVRVTWPRSGRRGKGVTDALLHEAAAAFGAVAHAQLAAEQGRAFFTYADAGGAAAAVAGMALRDVPALRGLRLYAEPWAAAALAAGGEDRKSVV